MRNKWSTFFFSTSGNRVKAFGCWEDIEWACNRPVTVIIDLQELKESIEIMEKMGVDYSYITVTGEDQPLVLSAERYKGGLLAIAPRIEE